MLKSVGPSFLGLWPGYCPETFETFQTFETWWGKWIWRAGFLTNRSSSSHQLLRNLKMYLFTFQNLLVKINSIRFINSLEIFAWQKHLHTNPADSITQSHLCPRMRMRPLSLPLKSLINSLEMFCWQEQLHTSQIAQTTCYWLGPCQLHTNPADSNTQRPLCPRMSQCRQGHRYETQTGHWAGTRQNCWEVIVMLIAGPSLNQQVWYHDSLCTMRDGWSK